MCSLHWLPISQRITNKTAVIMYKCLHDLTAYTSTSSDTGRRHLRSADTGQLIVPRTVVSLFMDCCRMFCNATATAHSSAISSIVRLLDTLVRCCAVAAELWYRYIGIGWFSSRSIQPSPVHPQRFYSVCRCLRRSALITDTHFLPREYLYEGSLGSRNSVRLSVCYTRRL